MNAERQESVDQLEALPNLTLAWTRYGIVWQKLGGYWCRSGDSSKLTSLDFSYLQNITFTNPLEPEADHRNCAKLVPIPKEELETWSRGDCVGSLFWVVYPNGDPVSGDWLFREDVEELGYTYFSEPTVEERALELIALESPTTARDAVKLLSEAGYLKDEL